MPFNSKGGKKYKKGKKGQPEKNIMIYKESGEDYAKVNTLYGAGRLEGLLQDGTTIMCIIPGRMKRKKWIKIGDIILINIRDYQKTKADILHCYNESQINVLKSDKCLPTSFIDSSDVDNRLFNKNIVFTENTEEDTNLDENDSTQNNKIKLAEFEVDLEEEINIEDI